jgi:uncharacterized protein
MNYHEQGVRVGPSPHGLGVFSLRRFAADELLGPIEGTIMDDTHYESDYCMELGDAALEPASPFRYLNHSCRPNCALVAIEGERETNSGALELWLRVEKDIAPGEELRIDYAWPAQMATPCRCRSSNCRKWIVAAEDLDQVLHVERL